MDSASVAAIVAAAGAVAAAAIAGWVTRKGAKESQHRTDQLTAAGLYTQLAQDQRLDLTTARGDVTKLTARVVTLENIITTMRRMARLHARWDEDLVERVNDRLPDLHIPPPPPLLDEDADGN